MAANFDSELFYRAVMRVEPDISRESQVRKIYELHRMAALGDAYGLREMADRYLHSDLPLAALKEDLQIAAELVALAAGPRVLHPEEADDE